jgi:hypothetical protein
LYFLEAQCIQLEGCIILDWRLGYVLTIGTVILEINTFVMFANFDQFCYQERRVDVDGININYVKVGSGPKPILCLPGALGQYWF